MSMAPEDRRIFELFAARVREREEHSARGDHGMTEADKIRALVDSRMRQAADALTAARTLLDQLLYRDSRFVAQTRPILDRLLDELDASPSPEP